MKKLTKKAQVLRILRADPWAGDTAVAKKVGCHPNYVSQLRRGPRGEPEPVLELTPETGVAPPPTTKVTESISALLDERGSRYGAFKTLAEVTQCFKSTMHLYMRAQLAPDQQEALDIIFGKISRIINGDPNYVDSWVDIAGYATLVADRLQGKER